MLEVLFIHILPGPQPGHRQVEVSLFTAPLMQTIFMERYHVPGPLTAEELSKDYEKNTGLVIVETFQEMDYMNIPAALVHGHGPFAWGGKC
jgi:ribulose-5-phosphate 4-epimerase/fuculose-1-phosphate aldolase